MALVKTSAPGYMKDPKTNVVINTDAHQYADYVRQKTNAREFNRMKTELAEMKQQIALLLSQKANTD